MSRRRMVRTFREICGKIIRYLTAAVRAVALAHMTTHRPLTPVLILAVLATAAGCSSSREEAAEEESVPAPEGLEGIEWHLVRFEGGDGTVLAPDDPSKYTLTFQPGGRLDARVDCNRGHGAWKSAGRSHVELGELALTRAMCPPGSLHDQVVKQLPYVRSYVLRDGHLFLSLMADGGIFELEPGTESGLGEVAEVGDASLESTRWRLTHLDGAPIPGDLPKEPHLVFDPGTGRVGGSSGCNQVSGTYRIEGDSLALGELLGTLMACERGMDTEQAFLEALEQVQRWSISGTTLELLDSGGRGVARFEGSVME